MSILLRGLYYVLKALVWGTMHLYFSRIEIDDPKGHLRLKAPLIVTSNHPNTLFDPLVIIIHLRAQVFFLANYGIFKNPIAGAILRTLYCIPIQRPEDIGSRAIKNDAAFAQTTQHLAHGGSIFIAPEGYSYMERHVRPLKTGTMRIALEAETQNNFELGIRILPVGVNYTAPNRFRSRLLIKVGEPIAIADYEAQNIDNHRDTVKALTQELDTRIKALTIHCANETEDHQLQIAEAADASSLTLHAWWQRGHNFAKQLHDWQTNDVEKYHDWTKNVADYRHWLQKNHLQAEGDFSLPSIFRALLLLLTLPIALFGALNFVLVWGIARLLWQKMKLYKGYESTVNYVSAFFVTIPLTYVVQFQFVIPLLHLTSWQTWLYALLILPCTGLLAYWWYRDFLRVWQGIQQMQLSASVRQQGEDLREQLADFFANK